MNKPPVLLDLFCGAGGCSMGYARAGFDVVGVDLHPQPNYPFEFHQSDAMTFDLTGFDVIHASPPCQLYSEMYQRNRDRHPDLIGPMRERLIASGVPYVMENVPRAPLQSPVMLCGSMFGLGVRRHRMFECSFPVARPTCDHLSQPRRYRTYDHGRWYMSRTVPVYGDGGGKAAKVWAEAMGIGWMSRRELAQAIPPAYTEFIGRHLMELF